jgi:hypothetical protein
MNRHGTAAQVNGYPGGCQVGYRSLTEAHAAWDHALTSRTVGPPPKPSQKAPPSRADMFPRPPPVMSPVMTPPPLTHFRKETAPSSPHVGVTKQQPLPPLSITSAYTMSASTTPSSTLSPPFVLCKPQSSSSSLPVSQSLVQPVAGSYYRTRPIPSDQLLSLSDEEAFWVVVEGWRPGVYQGK